MSALISWFRALALLLLVAGLAGCARPGVEASYLTEASGPYVLGPGDVLDVSVYGDANLTKTYTVDEQGAISMPLVGPVQVAGSTAQQTASKITAALAHGFMRSPNVTVAVKQYRPFFIQGAVGNSGQYPYVYGMTVRAAISTAGGYTETANRGNVVVYRQQDGREVQASVSPDFPIEPGDTIVVQDRWL